MHWIFGVLLLVAFWRFRACLRAKARYCRHVAELCHTLSRADMEVSVRYVPCEGSAARQETCP